jgi:Transposase DDE domain
MSALDEDWRVLLELFPLNWEELGRSTGAVKRLRGFDSVNDLLRTLLLHVGCGWSLRETAVQAKLAGIADVSDVTLLNRLRQAEDWLRQLCQQLWKENGLNLQPALKDRLVRLVDATTVKEPGKTGSQWRIHYSLRLPTLECDHFDLTPARGQNAGERLGRFPFRSGELVLADAGYSHPAGIAAVVRQGADVCVRVNPASLPLGGKQGSPFQLLEAVKTLQRAGEIGEWRVWVRVGDQRIAGRVCGVRKSEQAIEKAQRKLRRKQQQGKSHATPETREYACYVLVFTTLPSRLATTRQVLECYRLRWQIELTFKRLKSIVRLGHVPKLDDQSSRAWLYGKLFVSLLTERLVRVGSAISPWGYYLPEEAPAAQSVARIPVRLPSSDGRDRSHGGIKGRVGPLE